MATNSIKLFQFNQNFLQTVGIKFSKSNENRSKFEPMQLFLYGSLILLSMTSLAFLLYDAKSMVEYGIIFFTLLSAKFALVVYFMFIFKAEDNLKFTAICEKFIEKSESVILLRGI